MGNNLKRRCRQFFSSFAFDINLAVFFFTLHIGQSSIPLAMPITMRIPKIWMRQLSTSMRTFVPEVMTSEPIGMTVEVENARQGSKAYRKKAIQEMKENIEFLLDHKKDEDFKFDMRFEPFYKLQNKPIRQSIPEKPVCLSNEEINEDEKAEVTKYFTELVRFSYPRKEKVIYERIEEVRRYHNYKEIRNEILHYHSKKANGTNVSDLIKSDRDFYFSQVETQLSLLNMTKMYKDSKQSVAQLLKHLKTMKNYNVPLSAEYVYKLFYLLPRDGAQFFLRKLNEKGVPMDDILRDREYFKIYKFDELKQKILDRQIDFTYASYMQFTKLMIKEHRIEEGVMALDKIINSRLVEIPSCLVMYTMDHIISYEPHLAIPAAIQLQRLTGCSLKTYTSHRLLEMITHTANPSDESVKLFNIMIKNNRWHNELFKKNMNKQMTDEQKMIGTDEQLMKLYNDEYVTNSVPFKVGFDISIYEPIFEMFKNYSKFKQIRHQIDDPQISFNDLWKTEILPLLDTNKKSTFIKVSNYIVQKYLQEGEYDQIIPFVEYLKSKEINIEYTAYKTTIEHIVQLDQVKDQTNKTSTELQLASLLAFKLNLQRVDFIRDFLEKHPECVYVVDSAGNGANKKLLQQTYEELVNTCKWDVNQPSSI